MPWSRPGSGSALLFEAMVVELAKSQPVADVAVQVGEHDTRLWRLIRHYVDEAMPYGDYTGVEAISIDETSRGGHGCITVAPDLTERNVVCVTPGKDAHTVERFARDFMDHNGDPDRVRLVTCDMSRGFAKGIREHLPNAAKVIDRFHVVKHANKAVYKVHKAEDRENGLLKKDEVPVAQERVEPDRTPIGDQARPAEASAQDRPGLPDARDPPGHLRHQREQDRGRNGAQTPVLVDDAIEAGAHEGPRPTAPPPLGRHPGLLRPPAHQRGPRGPEQHHPERQDPREGLQEHGLFQHDDLPDLRQTRPANRRHLTRFTHTKQRKARNI